VLLRTTAAWDARLGECHAALKPLTEATLSATVKVDVTGRNVAEARRDLVLLDAHYTGGGSRRTFWGGKPAVVKETDWIEQAVSIEGLAMQRPEEIGKARRALEGWALLDAAWAPWSTWPTDKHGSPKTQAATLNGRADLLKRLLATGADASTLPSELRSWVALCFESGIPSASLVAALNRRLAEISLVAARKERDVLVWQLRQAFGNRDVVPALLA